MKIKRILSIVLTMAMLLGMLPSMGMTAYADSTTTTITPGTDEAKTGTGTMTITLTIAPATVDVTDVTLNPSTAQTIDVDGKVAFTATVAPNDATNKKVKWSINNSNVALYSNEECTTAVGTDATDTLTVYAKGMSAGSAKVTVTATNGTDDTADDKSANCDVTVNPITYEVTYKIVGGTWSDDSTTDKKETVQSGSKPASVPTGMKVSSGYMGGAWDTDPAEATITGATTFTYTFTAIPTYEVTYKVVGGTWSDDSTTDKTETVQSGSKPASVPTGMKASDGYTGGAWDIDPAEATITGATTFTYTFTAIPTYEVTYKVVGGTWSDDSTTDKKETVQSGLKPASVPIGMKASSGYMGGAWDTDPAEATITGATTFTYTFTAIPTYEVTYKIVGGTWSDDSTTDKTETVQSGSKPASVPTGMKASSGYTGGAWDTDPADATITGATTFTYTFTAKQAATVTKAPTAKTLTYSGQTQVLVTAGEASGGTMQYALGTATAATEPYTTSIPAKTDAGT